MNNTPLSSIIIPVYNMESTIGETVRSALAQTWRNLEVVVVDDGSTDGTAQILAELRAGDDRLRVLHQPNGGVSAARTAGLAAAKGEYITWLDGDDRLEPEMVEALISAARAHGKRTALCNYDNIQPDGRAIRRYALNGDIEFDRETALEKLMALEISQTLCANVTERGLYDEGGVVFRAGTLFEDVDNSWKLYAAGNGAVMVDRILFHRLIRPNSISNEKLLRKRVESCEVYLNRQQLLRKTRPGLDAIFYSHNLNVLFSLRKAVFDDSRDSFRQYRDRIRAICADFRAHEAEAVGNRGALARIEYRLMTGGSRAGFYLSRLTGVGTKKGSRLK